MQLIIYFTLLYFVAGKHHDNKTNDKVMQPSNVSTQPTCPRAQTNVELKYFICLMILIPITVIGNGLVCIVVLCSKSLRRHPMYIFLTSLAIADFLCGAVVMPIKAKIEWDGECFNLPWVVCWIFIIIEILVSINSTNHLCAIAVDRFVALKFPYRYQDLMSKRKLGMTLFGIWVFGLFWSLLGIFQWRKPGKLSILNHGNRCFIVNKTYFTTTYVLFYIAPIFLMIFIYSFVYKTTLRQISNISRNEVHSTKEKKERRKRKRQFKTVRSVVMVFTAYTVCWMPCVILILLVYYTPSIRRVFTTQWFSILRFLFINFLPHFNSTLNPFIYVLLNREFLSAVKELFRKLSRTKKVHAMPQNNFHPSLVEMAGVVEMDSIPTNGRTVDLDN